MHYFGTIVINEITKNKFYRYSYIKWIKWLSIADGSVSVFHILKFEKINWTIAYLTNSCHLVFFINVSMLIRKCRTLLVWRKEKNQLRLFSVVLFCFARLFAKWLFLYMELYCYLKKKKQQTYRCLTWITVRLFCFPQVTDGVLNSFGCVYLSAFYFFIFLSLLDSLCLPLFFFFLSSLLSFFPLPFATIGICKWYRSVF